MPVPLNWYRSQKPLNEYTFLFLFCFFVIKAFLSFFFFLFLWKCLRKVFQAWDLTTGPRPFMIFSLTLLYRPLNNFYNLSKNGHYRKIINNISFSYLVNETIFFIIIVVLFSKLHLKNFSFKFFLKNHLTQVLFNTKWILKFIDEYDYRYIMNRHGFHCAHKKIIIKILAAEM